MKTVPNRDVPFFAHCKEEAQGYGNFHTSKGLSLMWGNWLPDPIYHILDVRRKEIEMTIYSYNTPMAWLDNGVWFMPEVRYSATTGKHQSHIRNEIGVYLETIPGDCSLDEYMRVVDRLMYFEGSGSKMRTKAGIHYG